MAKRHEQFTRDVGMPNKHMKRQEEMSLGEVGAPGSSPITLAPWLRPQMATNQAERAEGEVEKRR